MTVQDHIIALFQSNAIPKEYVYHDLAHTQEVVQACHEIGTATGLDDLNLELLTIAAWFHDTGYQQGPENHEQRSAANARDFLTSTNHLIQYIPVIEAIILATKLPQKPTDLLQKIICDADLSHLGSKTYWDRTAKVRQEIVITQHKTMTEKEWVDFELTFMLGHRYHTDIAKELYDARKFKHIVQLRKQKIRLNPSTELTMDDIYILEKEKENKEKKAKWKALAKENEQDAKHARVGRGVETMYRTTYNTHNNLSALADHKANLMLSVNTIMISITLSALVPNLAKSPGLVYPTVFLLCVNLVAIVFATLSTRPKVTTGEVTLDDIRSKRSNLLFFGNFYNMKLEDFQWGMMEMIKDTDFQYSSMTRDLYYLGKVLAQKYKYLTLCYNIFMFGMITTVILFAYAFIIGTDLTMPTKIK
jgi:predicted metal-dependent HD superfamily phosphohydrolase